MKSGYRAFCKMIVAACIVNACSVAAHAQIDTVSAHGFTEAAVARKNKYYLPAEVLSYSTILALTREQVTKLNNIQATLKLKERETDISNTRNEHMLDSLFKKNTLNEGVLIFYTNRYGLYAGEYRGAVLMACYNTRKVLTAQQANKLATMQKP